MNTDVVSEIRERVDLVDMVSAHVRLTRAGNRWRGLCPFHQEKTPSFYVSPELHMWHCFGCGEHGDCFSFLMKMEGLTFPEALARLGEKVGVSVERHKPSMARGEREGMLQTLSASARFFRECLARDERARKYMEARGISPEFAETFGVGFAPASWESLAGFLGKEKVDLNLAEKAGLVGRRRTGGFYDRFRNRLMFPVTDASGQVVAFGGRDLGQEGPKYLNSPETPVFRKSGILYAFSLARKAIQTAGQAVIMEGYLDVVSAHQAGVGNAVAAMGTAFGEEHVRLLKLACERVVLCFDSDAAGLKAALSAGEVLEKAGFDTRVAVLPAGDDPDSLVHSGRAAVLVNEIENARPSSEHRLDVLMSRFDLKSPADRTRMLAQACQVLSRVENVFERDRLMRKLAPYHPSFDRGADFAEGRIRMEVDRLAKAKNSPGGVPRSVRRADAPEDGSPWGRAGATRKAEFVLLRALLAGGDLAQMVSEKVSTGVFVTEVSRLLASEIITRRQLGEDASAVALGGEGLDARVVRLASALLMLDEPPLTAEVVEDCIARVVNAAKRSDLLRLQERFKRGELARDDPDYERFLALQRQRNW